MSVHVMAQVWRHGPKDGNELLVLLAIADFSDDDGYCWPSMASIATKARMTERGARKIARRLEEQGYLSCEVGGGRGGSNRYRVHVINPERETGNTVPPERQTGNANAETRNTEAETRNGGSAKPSRTVKEPSESKEVRETLASHLGIELADEFIKHRQKLKKPLTAFAAKLFVAELNKCADPIAATQQAILKGWQTVYPEKKDERPSKSADKLRAFIAGAE